MVFPGTVFPFNFAIWLFSVTFRGSITVKLVRASGAVEVCSYSDHTINLKLDSLGRTARNPTSASGHIRIGSSQKSGFVLLLMLQKRKYFEVSKQHRLLSSINLFECYNRLPLGNSDAFEGEKCTYRCYVDTKRVQRSLASRHILKTMEKYLGIPVRRRSQPLTILKRSKGLQQLW